MDMNSEVWGGGFETDMMATVPYSFADGDILIDRLNKIKDITTDMIGGMDVPRLKPSSNLSPSRLRLDSLQDVLQQDMNTIVIPDTPYDESLYLPDLSSLAPLSDEYYDDYYSLGH